MRPFHYHETQNLNELNIFERIIAVNGWEYTLALSFLGFAMLGIVLGMIASYKSKKPEKTIRIVSKFLGNPEIEFYILIGSIILLVGTIGVGLLATFNTYIYKSIGLYEAKVKVAHIEKTEKVGEKTQYTFDVRLMDGQTEDKKEKPLKIETTHRHGLKNGDIAMIKTPKMNFMGGESKDVSYSQLISEEEEIGYNAEPEEVPKKVDADELSISKS